MRETNGWPTRTVAEDMDLTWTFYAKGYGVRFIPDWFVHFKGNGQRPQIFEVKGFMESDAAVKIKVAAGQHRWADFWLATKRKAKAGGGWQIQQILP